MKAYNLIMVFHSYGQQVLMCQRKKEPFSSQYNFVGGKVEAGESPMEAAYRELEEESGITAQDIRLTHLTTFCYHVDDIELQWFAGRLSKEVELVEEVNHLHWISLTENFFDTKRFAGIGNIGHMLLEIQMYHPEIITS